MENGNTSHDESADMYMVSHKTSVCEKADLLLTQKLPKKISALDSLSKSPTFAWESIEEVKKCSLTADGKIRIENTYLQDCFAVIKPLMREFIDDCLLLKTWITLLVPKTEDGDNLGVQLQQSTIYECDTFSVEIKYLYLSINNYYGERAKLISKLDKYGGTAEKSIKNSIDEFDEYTFLKQRMAINQLYFNYLSIYDSIMKNIDKIKKPKNDSRELCLY